MKNKWMWAIGIALVFIVLFVLPSLLRLLFNYDDYGMMRYGYGWHMLMISGGGMMFLAWLILLGLLVLIVLGIAWLIKMHNAAK